MYSSCRRNLLNTAEIKQLWIQWVWISNPLKTCLRHKIPMTLVEFFHRYWLSLSGEWSSVNIKYGHLWSSTPWYGGLWQGDQKPPKPNSSPIFYQLFSYRQLQNYVFGLDIYQQKVKHLQIWLYALDRRQWHNWKAICTTREKSEQGK